MARQGLISVFTGDGKGKTTSALGLMLRAVGHGHKVCFLQFIKGGWKCGEHQAVTAFNNQIELHTLGKGFTWKSDNLEEDIRLARKAWEFAEEKIRNKEYDMIVLDELTYLIKYGMVDEDTILAGLAQKPESMHVVITGRNASEGLIEAADLVTEMKKVKHPYENGVKAQKGFEF